MLQWANSFSIEINYHDISKFSIITLRVTYIMLKGSP